MKVQLTTLERTVLDEITEDDFYQDGIDSAIWADCFVDGCSIPVNQSRGVLSSLIKKDIIYHITPGREGVIVFTPFGKEVMQELGYN